MRIASFFLFISVAMMGVNAAGDAARLDLAGVWRFQLDPDDKGIEEAWFNRALPDQATLPGSLNENGIGAKVTAETQWTGTLTSPMWHQEERFAPYRDPENTKILFWLQPEYYYVGAAWYQRDIEIPDAFAGKSLSLYLERCHWETQLWVDGTHLGMRDSLSVPHVYDLTAALTPGKHTLTLRVDNRYKIDVGVNAHSVSDNTQTNWNGVAGAMHVEARPLVRLGNIQAYPDIAARKVRLTAEVLNGAGTPLSGTCAFVASTSSGHRVVHEISIDVPEPHQVLETEMALGDDVQLWSEHHPNVYVLEAQLTAASDEGAYSDAVATSFGMRELGQQGTQFTVNGQLTQLRGTLECAIFPRTGYPPTNVDDWKKIFHAARAYGLNHLRFHSWCPPEAAFSAADELGFMLHVEGPFWTGVGNGGAVDEYIYQECDRILQQYGNHPSFCFLAYGNEPNGSRHEAFLGELVNYWKNKDSRRRYTAAAGWPMIDANEYHVTYKPRVHVGGKEGIRFRTQPFASTSDYRDFVKQWPVPVVSHEIGQWCVFPNLAEMPKYTGPLKPRNFEIVRDMLEQQGMLDLADDFLMASGKLQTLCYKEEIEAALRTPGFGGFQLLDLHDFPGQGTALVGMIDPFWESKGYVTPEEFRRFCGPTVPLLRMDACVFTDSDAFRGAAEVTHFGDGPLIAPPIHWQVTNAAGAVLRQGELHRPEIPVGSACPLGEIAFDFSGIPAPAQLKLTVRVADFENGWDLWVYPDRPAVPAPGEIAVVARWDEAALDLLNQGRSVLLLPEPGCIAPSRFGPIPAGFPPVFWNTFWFPTQELRTLGLLMDPAHPLFAHFPTEFHSNWQWWHLATHAQVIPLDALPPTITPLVRVIDDWNTCRRLGLVFEARVGAGKLLVCGSDIVNELETRPATRQFREALLAYMTSDAFNPEQSVAAADLAKVFQTPRALFTLKPRITASSAESGYEPDKAIDGDVNTFWHTQWQGDAPLPYPHWLRLEFEKPVALTGLRLIPRQDMTNGRIGRYQVCVGEPEDKRGTPIAQGQWNASASEQVIQFDAPHTCRMLLLRALDPASEGHPWATIAELDVLQAE